MNKIAKSSIGIIDFVLMQIFSVQLTLGDQTWEAEGSSIKKAQHAAAAKALSETTLPEPSPRPTKAIMNNNPGTGIVYSS